MFKVESSLCPLESGHFLGQFCMLDTKQFISSIKQIAEEKGIPEEKVIETIEAAIGAAYKRDYGKKGQIIKAKLDSETGNIDISQIKFVIEGVDKDGYVIGELPEHGVEERDEVEAPSVKRGEASQPQSPVVNGVKNEPDGITGENGINEDKLKVKFNPEKYLTLEEARKIKKKAKVGDEVITKLESKTDFGRIAAQTAKQVIVQRLREVEREVIYNEFKQKEGEAISGIVQRNERGMVYMDLGRTNGLLIPAEQIPQDSYRIGQRLRLLIIRVEETNKGPAILLSRSHPRLVLKLFEFEVPEIEAGSVKIKAIAREAGSRSKIAVISEEEGIDPIGSLVGQKGVRVQTIINELGGEKIDIIEWHESPVKFIASALSPAKVVDVKILDERRHHALVEVADDQFSLAIGRKGQNVRLAAKLTGWKIDVRSPQAAMSTEEAMVPESGSGQLPKVETLEEIPEAKPEEKPDQNEL